MKREWVALLMIVLVCGLTGMREPRFFDPRSLNSVLLWMPLIAVAAMGQTLVIVTRGIDISIGSILAFAGIAVGQIFHANPTMPIPIALGIGALVGTGLGLFNGLLVTKGRLSPIVVTIGTLTAFRGATFLLSRGEEIDSSMVPEALTALARTGPSVGGVTLSALLLISLGVSLAVAAFVCYVQAGRDIYAYGSNPEAARLRGISPDRINLLVYALSGAVAGLAGVMYAARFGFVNPGSAGQNFELNVIAAVAIGGVKITGGYGSVGGVLLGCLLLSCINVALAVLGVDANWQLLTYGIVILVALLADTGTRQLHNARLAREAR